MCPFQLSMIQFCDSMKIAWHRAAVLTEALVKRLCLRHKQYITDTVMLDISLFEEITRNNEQKPGMLVGIKLQAL